MTTHTFNLQTISPSWQPCLKRGLSAIQSDYLDALTHTNTWLPGPEKIFNAFSLPVERVNYVLIGESPYPRPASANGYAFWDADVKELWSPTGLSKKVNRATSLRNILKMLLIAEGALSKENTTQEEIACLDKSSYIQTNDELFGNLLQHGFLLLNATLVLQDGPPQKDARAWFPFVKEILHCLLELRPEIKLILFGRIASIIEPLIPAHTNRLVTEHPYNISFITNPEVIDFFKPLNLLRHSCHLLYPHKKDKVI